MKTVILFIFWTVAFSLLTLCSPIPGLSQTTLLSALEGYSLDETFSSFVYDKTVYLNCRKADGQAELWRLNPDGTQQLISDAINENIRSATWLNTEILYSAWHIAEGKMLLHRYDPQTGQNEIVGDLGQSGFYSGRGDNFVIFGGIENWLYDGVQLRRLPWEGFMRSFIRLSNGKGIYTITNLNRHYCYVTDNQTETLVASGPNFISLYSDGVTAWFLWREGLWKSDGSFAGTSLVKNISPTNNANTSDGLYHNGILYFEYFGLWRSDGTSNGTYELNNLNVYAIFKDQNNPYVLTSDGSIMKCEPDGLVFQKKLLNIVPFNNRKLSRGGLHFSRGYGGEIFDFAIYKNDSLRLYDLWQGEGNSGASCDNSSYYIYEQDNMLFLPGYSPGRNEGIWRIKQPGGPAERIQMPYEGTRPINISIAGFTDTLMYLILSDQPDRVECRFFNVNAAIPPLQMLKPEAYEWRQCLMNSFGTDMATDESSGATYVAASTQSAKLASLVDSFTLSANISSLSNTTSLYRLDSTGAVVWARVLGSVGSETRNIGLVAKGAGRLFAGGMFEDQAILDQTVLQADGLAMFICRLNPEDGACLWARSAFLGKEGKILQMRSDEQGNVYVGGLFIGSKAKFGAVTLNSAFSSAFFVACYDAEGVLKWAQVVPHVEYPDYFHESSFDMLIGSNQQLYILNGDAGAESYAFCRPNKRRIGLSALNKQSGNIVWAKSFSSDNVSYGATLAQLPGGQILLSGRIRSLLTLEQIKLEYPCEDTYSLLSGGAFAAVFSSAGDVLSARVIGDDDFRPYSAVCDTDGNFYLAGLLSRAPAHPYPGYTSKGYENLDGTTRVCVRKYNPNFQLVNERQFYKEADIDDASNVLIQVNDKQQIIILDNIKSGQLFDTLGVSGICLDNYQNHILQFTMPEVDAPPVTKDGLLTQEAMRLYPNPTHDYIYLFAEDPDFNAVDVVVFDVSGRRINTVPVYAVTMQHVYLDVRNLPAGVYQASAIVGQKRVTKSFIKI